MLSPRRFSVDEIEAFIQQSEEYDLEGRSILHLFSIDKIRKEFNGIGPDRMGKTYRKILTFLGHRYLSATMIHDMDYVKGGTKQDFHESNKRLKRNLKKILSHLFSRWNPWYWVERLSIQIIYDICEDVGWEGFHKGN